MSIKGALDEVDVSIIQFQNLEPATLDYLDKNIVKLSHTYIITEISFLCDAVNMPAGFKGGLDVVKTGYCQVEIINKWGTSQKPLALWFNYGTRDHGPRTALKLHWIDKKTGKHIYARWVRGVPKTLVMEKGIEIGMQYLIQAALRESQVDVSKKLGIVA